MELRLAKMDRKQSKTPSLSLEELHQKYLKNEHIFYFAPTNPHKDMLATVAFLEKKNCRVHLSQVQVSSDEKDFIYQMHII
ncbi:HP0268 family nuclease [Helicobacter sp. NHP22-001]|uniref:HP0268 family nuclease n=1 Tax=Helicobacter sp. NHP22-001 TaxID=3040202 RepID=UPI00244D7D79|nr:HP0268 family nuclease [Helicobacter sp. NHP22-001]GMB96049.1 nuclease [Helicobacter sp. NHP22-001]